MKKKNILWITSMCLVILALTIFNIGSTRIRAASDKGFEWKKNDTMDELLQIVNNKAGNDEVLINWNLEDYGEYKLEYYLTDKVKTQVIVEHEVNKVTFKYNMIRIDTDSGTETSITESEFNKSFAMMNYDLLVPQLETITDKTNLFDGDSIEFEIVRGASSKYPGASFVINNLPVRFKWNMQTKTISFLTKGVQKGCIVPFELTTPDNTKCKLQLLRTFDNFKIEPTHWVKDSKTNTNEDKKTLIIPNDSDVRPGSKPGLRITFDRPKIFNVKSAQYEIAASGQLTKADGDLINAVLALKDIRDNGDNTDIILALDDKDGKFINTPQTSDDNTNVQYDYDDTTGTYTIELVKDRENLKNGDTEFLQWDNLDSSRVYTAIITLEESPNYIFNQYEPINKYAYTYLDYIVKRASMDDAYLDIVPYAGSNADDLEYTIYHSKTEKSIFGKDDVWLKHYHNQKNSDLNIYIPVPFANGSSQEFYQVGVQFASTPIKSQTIKYVPNADKDVPPPVPRIKGVKNLAVVPPNDDDSNIPKKVQFDLAWHAPDRDLLESMLSDENSAIYYELLFNDIPIGQTNNPYTITKVFKVFKGTVLDKEGNPEIVDGKEVKRIQVQEVDTGKSLGTTLDVSNFLSGYNKSENLFEIRNVVIKDNNGWSKPVRKDVTNKDEPYKQALTQDDEYDYEFPGINFIRMRSLYVNNVTGGVGESDRSIADSISLSMLKYDIPRASNIQYTPRITTESEPRVGINVGFNLVDIRNYDNYMVTPLNKNINNINYRIYISKDKKKILNLESLMTTDDENDVKKILDLEDTTSGETRKNNNGFYKTEDFSDDVELTEEELNRLRSDDVLYSDISTRPTDAGSEELKLLNLDPNTNYYIRIVTMLDISDSIDTSIVVETRRSEPSGMISVTSPVVPTNPGDEELVPLAPENMDVTHFDENMISGEITWEIPTEIELVEDKYGFELISIENKSLPDSLSRGKMLQDIFASDSLKNTIIEGWRLYVKDGEYILKSYDKNNKRWINASNTYKVEGNKITIIDDNNLPNKVYYYYARTIKIKSEVPKAVSAWVADSLTTAPIKRPVNLIIDHNSKYSYDSKRETVIRFDAPIPDDYYSTGDYGIDVFVKGDKDLDYSDTRYNSDYLGQIEGANDGYTRVYYKVSGLKPGTTYNIKVRIQDRTKPRDTLPNGDRVYPRSSFSERVSTRTEFDQKDYDRENKYIEYINYYKDKAQELLKTPYWIVDEDDNEQVLKYRQDYNIGDLKYVNEGKYYLLDAIEGVQDYYLPAQMIETANNNGVTIMVRFPEGNLGIRPYALSKDTTTEILEKIDEINKYSSSARDYYIRLVVNIGEYKARIDGRKPTTNLVNFDIQVVGSDISESDLEGKILSEFDKVVESKKTYLMNELDKELESGMDDVKLLKIVNDTLELVKKSHRNNVKRLIEKNIQDDYNRVEELDNQVRIEFNVKSLNETFQGYRKEKIEFVAVDTDNYGNTYNIETDKTGAYIIAPNLTIYGNLDENYNGMVTDIITEYSLKEIFSSKELSNLDYEVYNYQLLSATARILGASKGYDNQEWLEELNIDVPVSDMYGHMKNDEAYYIFMQAYSAKNDINIDSINITDYNIIEDINDVSEEYRDVLIKGANLGIIKLIDGRILPNEKVVMETVLEMLTRIDNNIDW
ncbi:hypothetical protein SH1V18_30670 [Vallitalea longa]|uniref:Uncharacterized protein n=1 Tax=Vallitalea longa TaxID=2936439 RepID=A0A9W6DGI9_9FIRM|nr:hypothetical protein [Vallitalea longa]GKX30587.1 hypothetical protein SH1V18_30670 [Vallitalea longa]